MKTLLVMPNYGYSGPYMISLGIMYLSSYLKQQGFDVAGLNLNHYGPGKLSETLRAGNFDVVATGGLFPQYANYRAIIETVRRESPKSVIVLGGAIASADAEFALDSLRPDYLILGEAELPMAAFLLALAAGEGMDSVPGLAYLKDGRMVRTAPPVSVGELDTLPWPDYDAFEFERYLNEFHPSFDQTSWSKYPQRRIAPVISGRGCAAKCTFCFRLTTAYRWRTIDNVITEIKHLKSRYGINEVALWDDLFSTTKARLMEFCGKVQPLDLVWSCQLRLPVVDEEVLRAMKGAGCNWISYGLESASPRVLHSMRKGLLVPKMEQALLLTQKAGLTIQGNFIFGDPAETWETAEETLSFYRKHRFDFSNSVSLGAIIPYPGTRLYQDLKEQGKIGDLRRFYETGMHESGRYLNMTQMPEADFQRLVTKILPAEVKKGRVFGRVAASKELGPDLYSIAYVCPLCRQRSDGVRLAVSARDAIGSFRIACPNCLQRVYVPKLGLLGPQRLVRFAFQALMVDFWDWLKTKPVYTRVRYNPRLEAFWDRHKAALAERHLRDPNTPALNDLPFFQAVKFRARFVLELVASLVSGK
ncbi:MAG: radical SAM protein [Elusimicrobia bacterium]|nr:radical SAM protein [Elusimicrobiota bacterium]